MRPALPIALLLVLLATAWSLREGVGPAAVAPGTGAASRAVDLPAELDPPLRGAEGRASAQDSAQSAAAGEEPAATHGLDLRVFDAATGAPASSRVTLWRLGLPAGDQRCKVVEVPATGLLLADVVPGRYRAILHAGAAGAPDAEAFDVRDELTRVELALQRPARHHVLVRLFDADGLRLMRVGRRVEYDEWNHFSPGDPDWTTPRSTLDPPEDDDEPPEEEGEGLEDFGDYGERFSSSGNTWQWIDDPGPGFVFGPTQDDARGTSQATGYLFREGRARGRGHIGGAPARDRSYVGVLPDPDPYLERILLPDGRDGFDIQDRVTVTGGLLLVEEGAARNPWRLVPIEVCVRHPEYEDLTFTHRLADPWPRPHRLVPRNH